MVTSSLDILLAFGSAVLVFVCGRLGYAYARRRKESESTATLDIAQTATFTIASLLLAFAFSLTLSRYDDRRTVVTNEANAIGTTVLRTDMLPPASRAAERALLRQYLETRIDFQLFEGQGKLRDAVDAKSSAIQTRMWSIAAAAAARDPRNTEIPLFITTLNETIDLSITQGAVMRAHLPTRILAVLVLVVLIASVLFGAARREQLPPNMSLLALALTFGIVISTIVDLDQPRVGAIRVDLTPLYATRAAFATPARPGGALQAPSPSP